MHPSHATPMAITSPPNLLQLPTPPAFIRSETFHQNTITLTGTLQAVRESVDPNAPSLDPDIVLTLAVTDRYAPLERRDPTPTRQRPAHTLTLRLPRGRPLDGHPLSLSPRQRVRVTGYLRDHAETLSLFRVWASLKLFERLHSDDGQHLLTCCPPGPPLRAKRYCNSDCGRCSSELMMSVESMVSLATIAAQLTMRACCAGSLYRECITWRFFNRSTNNSATAFIPRSILTIWDIRNWTW